MSRPPLVSLAALLLVFSLTTPAGETQAQAPANPPTDAVAPAEPAVETIPTGEIAVRSERAKRALGDAEATLQSGDFLTKAAEKVALLAERFDTQHKIATTMLVQGSSTSAIDQALLDASILRTALDTEQGKLSQRGDEVDAARTNVAKTAALWQATFQAASTGETSQAVLSQIDVVLEAARAADEQGKKIQGRIVELQSQVAQMTEQLAADVDGLDQLRRDLTGAVFQRDRAPVWDYEQLGALGPSALLARLLESHHNDRLISETYLLQRRDRIAVHVAAFVLLVALMFLARRRRLDDDIRDVAEAGLIILRYPFSLAALLILLLSVFTFGDLPRPLQQARGVLLMIPAVILLRRFLRPEAHGALYAVALLWIVDRVRLLLAPSAELPRVVVFLESLMLLLLVIFVLRGSRIVRLLPEQARERYGGAAVLLCQVLLGAAVVGVISELCGYHALATIIISTAAFCPIGAIVLWGAVRAVDGLTELLLSMRPLRFLGMVSHHRALLRRRITGLVGLAAALWWTTLVLGQMQLSHDLWQFLVTAITTDGQIGSVSLSLGDVLLFFLTIWLSFRISRFLRFMLDEDFYPRVSLKKGQPYAFSMLAHYTIITLGVLIAVLASGLDFDRLSIMVGALSVGIGFGLQGAVNNFVSGLILLTERPVEVGDTIALGEVFGEVDRIGLRSTMVRTWQGAEIIIPNADLISLQVTNWTHTDQQRRFEIPVHVAYGTDPEKVKDLLLAVARAEPRVLEDPGPFVLMMGMGASALEFELRAWTDDFDSFLTVKSTVTMAVLKALAEADIEVPFPQHVMHAAAQQD